LCLVKGKLGLLYAAQRLLDAAARRGAARRRLCVAAVRTAQPCCVAQCGPRPRMLPIGKVLPIGKKEIGPRLGGPVG
jgi:hypothetical protein